MSDELADLASALRAVPGVSSVEVEPDAPGSTGALRLRLGPGVDGVEVARVAGELFAQHAGTAAPASVVNVLVQSAEPVQLVVPAAGPTPNPVPSVTPPDAVPAQRGLRLSVGRTDVATEGLESVATVVLSSPAASATGWARGLATKAGVHHAVAQATLRALEQLQTQPVGVGLDQLLVTAAGDRSTVLIGLTLITAGGVEQLTGSAIVRQDEAGAVVRATLDALNRRLESLLS